MRSDRAALRARILTTAYHPVRLHTCPELEALAARVPGLPAWTVTSGALTGTRGMTGPAARRLGRTGASRVWCAGPSGTAMGWVGPRPVRCEAPLVRLVSQAAENAAFTEWSES